LLAVMLDANEEDTLKLRDTERLTEKETLLERLTVDVGLADRLGVRLGVGRQAQQAPIVTRQLSSLSAPLAK
jgi:hypothetical protein